VIQPTPNPSGSDLAVSEAVSCPAATSCEAVGGYYTAIGGTQYLLAEGWNGSTWTIESTPAPNGYSFPLGISCTAVTTCTSAGEYFPNDGGTTDNLAYQLN